MRSYKIRGIIIKRKNIGEADRMLTVFTKDQGKIQIKAKGVRKITSRRSSHVELLNYCMFTLYKGQGIPVLTEIETLESFQSIKTNLRKTGFAYHICELIDGLCPEGQENANVFGLFHDTLQKLSDRESYSSPAISLADSTDSPADISLINYHFELQLLTTLGYWSNGKILSAAQTEYIIESILERKLKARQFIPQFS